VIRTITLWCNYDPKRRLIIEQAQYKYMLHKLTGCVFIKLKGTYARKPK
jgi:hypothetical protein